MALIGTTTKNYISSLNFMDYPEIMRKVLDVTGEQRTIVDIMEMTGRFVKSDAVEFEHFTNKHLFKAGVIDTGGITVGSDGAWDTDHVNDLQATVTDADGMPVVGEIVMTPSGGLGYVKTIDGAKQFTAQALDTTAQSKAIDPAGTLADGQSLIYFSQASAEGSTDPSPRRPSWKNSKNYVQIFKEAAKITDLQKVTKIEVEYGGKMYVMYKLQNDTLFRHKAKIAYGLLAGRKALFAEPTSGSDVYMTQGLRHYIKEGDGTVNTTGGIDFDLSGAITKPNFLSISRQLDKKGAPKEYWFWAGGDLRAELDDAFGDLTRLTSGGVQYNSFGKSDARKKALDLGINSVVLYGRTWHFKTIEAYDHPEVFGATGFDFAGGGFAIPTGKIKIDLSQQAVERMRVRYLDGDGTNLKYLETLTGKLAPTPTDTESALTVSYQSVMGLEVLGNEHFVAINNSSVGI